MGAVVSKSSDAPQQQFSGTQVIRLLKAQRQEYERKFQEGAIEAASLQKLLKEARITERRLEKKITATKKMLKETAGKRKLEEEASKITLQKEAAMKELKEKNEEDRSSDSSRDYGTDAVVLRTTDSSTIISNRRSYHAKTDGQKKVSCPHTSQGCKLNIRLADLEIHVKECPFMEHDCPMGAVFGKFNWQGELSGLSKHFGEIHPNCFVPELGLEFQLRFIHGNQRYVRLIGKDGFFVLHAKISDTDSKIYIKVQLLGMKESAMKCDYHTLGQQKRQP